jgi:hypothetical protein
VSQQSLEFVALCSHDTHSGIFQKSVFQLNATNAALN